MKNVLIIVAGILSIISFIPYITDIIKKKTHPNLITWSTWMLVSGINTAAAISDNALHTALLSGASALGDVIIVVLSLKRGVKKYTPFDIVCQVIAAIGIVLWLATGNPSIAVILSLSVIVIAALPTWRHAWLKPSEETWEGFAIAVVAGILTLFSLRSFTLVALAFPIVLIVNCSVMTSIILVRRRLMQNTVLMR
jgi:hypothetical protein